jgi:hypothetical protein
MIGKLGLFIRQNVIALLALFVALGGTSYAATSLPRNSVGTKQLKKNAVTSAKIKDGAVTAAKIATSGLTVPNATNATNATNASELGGQAASYFLPTTGTAANSDKLDGTDSSGFLQGTGKVYTLAVGIPRNTDGVTVNTYTPSPAVAPGFANIAYDCPPAGTNPPNTVLWVTNLSGGGLNVFVRNGFYIHTFPGGLAYWKVASGDTQPNGTFDSDITTLTIQGFPPSTGVQTVTTAEISTAVRDFDCHFQIQALTTNP